jgi:CRISPR-associated protein Cas1
VTTLLNTLYVTLPQAYLRLENNTLCVDVEREKRMQVPLHHIGSVVCYGNVMISPFALHRCAEEGISVVLLDANGRFKARLEGPVNGNILLRQAQFAKAQQPEGTLEIARACVAGKIKNCRYVLLRAARDANEADAQQQCRDTAGDLGKILKKLPGYSDLDALRGAEGDAARRYFEAQPSLLRPDIREAFTMNGRTRRPPLDRYNALLSFLYALLTHDCNSALQTVGLDPQLGFLHTVRPGRPALALDLMEEFRPILADRLALTLVNRLQIQSDDFESLAGGTYRLSDTARKTLLIAYQERKKEELTHPLLSTKISIGLIPQLQARLLARHIREDMASYVPFLMR